MTESSTTTSAFYPASIEVNNTASGSDNVKTVLLIGDKSVYESPCQVSLDTVRKCLGKSDTTNDIELLKSVWTNSLQPSKDKGESTELFFHRGTSPLRVVMGVLPTEVGRHSTPTKSHSISSIVGDRAENEGMVIVVMLSNATYALAASCAVARAFPHYTRKTPSSNKFDVVLTLSSPTPLDSTTIQRCKIAAKAIRHVCAMVDAPCNEFGVDEAVSEAQAVVNRLKNLKHEVTFQVIRGEELNQKGLGGIYGVGRAASTPPALIICSYLPPNVASGSPSIVWVGKGIVYDTGGLSLKDSANMVGMKHDMGGAGALLGGFEAAVEGGWCTESPLHYVGCFAENAIGPLATRPDDIHKLYSGKTVEINNTDAEGRLVLSDGVAFAAAHLNPKIMLDMATLTGAQGVATGQKHAALYCNDDELELKVVSAGKLTGDLAHPLPYSPEYFRKEFASKVADMKNSVKSRTNAPSCCAGQFIANNMENYLQSGGKWAHVDMAYPSHENERATAYGLALVLGLLQELNKK